MKKVCSLFVILCFTFACTFTSFATAQPMAENAGTVTIERTDLGDGYYVITTITDIPANPILRAQSLKNIEQRYYWGLVQVGYATTSVYYDYDDYNAQITRVVHNYGLSNGYEAEYTMASNYSLTNANRTITLNSTLTRLVDGVTRSKTETGTCLPKGGWQAA